MSGRGGDQGAALNNLMSRKTVSQSMLEIGYQLYGAQAEIAYKKAFGTNAGQDRLNPNKLAVVNAFTNTFVLEKIRLAGNHPNTERSQKSSTRTTGQRATQAVTPSIPPLTPEQEAAIQKANQIGTQEEPGYATSQTVGVGSTSFDINMFRSIIGESDSLPMHSFLVTFSPFDTTQAAAPVLNKYIQGTVNSNLVLRCESATLPAPTLFKESVHRFGYGPREEMAYGIQFNDDFSLTFLMDKYASHVKFFDEWLNYITNFKSKGGGNMMISNRGYKPYEVGYKDDYSNLQMNIWVYDRQQNPVIIYELYDVFPVAVNAIDVSWNDTDQLMKYTVRFAFTDYTVQTPQARSFNQSMSAYDQIINRRSPADDQVVGGQPNLSSVNQYVNDAQNQFGLNFDTTAPDYIYVNPSALKLNATTTSTVPTTTPTTRKTIIINN